MILELLLGRSTAGRSKGSNGGRVQAMDRAVVSCVVQVRLDCDLLTGPVSGVAANMSAIEVAKDRDPCLRIAFLICKAADGAGDHVVNCRLIVVSILPPETCPIPGHSRRSCTQVTRPGTTPRGTPIGEIGRSVREERRLSAVSTLTCSSTHKILRVTPGQFA
jgi:hypothetical protein